MRRPPSFNLGRNVLIYFCLVVVIVLLILVLL